jgi:hypothetical protein
MLLLIGALRSEIVTVSFKKAYINHEHGVNSSPLDENVLNLSLNICCPSVQDDQVTRTSTYAVGTIVLTYVCLHI